MNKKTIAVWCLYDFANSIFYAVIPATIWSAYYANKIVGNSTGLGDLWWGRIVSSTMLFVAVTSPVMGALADYAGVRKRLLVIYTLISAAVTTSLAIVGPGMVMLGFALSVIAYIGAEGGVVFYNAYLPEIAPVDYQGRVSGWGFALGYAGSFAGLLVALPFVRKDLFGPAFLSTGIGFLLFALPALFWLPADAPARMSFKEAAVGGLRSTLETFRLVWRLREPRRFLSAYFFYEDGVNTVITMAAVFAAKTLGFEATELIGLFAIVQVSALLGALLWAKPTDRRGPKFVVMIMLIQWSIIVVLAYFVQTKVQFFVIAVLAGSGLGAVQAASRAFMASLIPAGKEAEFFGLYALCGKSASIMGPLLFGSLSRYTEGNQRLSILSIMALYIVGASLLARVRAGGPKSLGERA
ncbi:MAG: MFS transporter [Acidobacteria bacterium]|nr:MFS transporter [Acidobacteriota bacterium]